ncbi:MAG: hypothetical protein KBF73_00045 [Flavobacteriales bacterium]|nr:hypothetical protein [Flavobacteriales bacterium]
MNTEKIIVETDLSTTELVSKLRDVTITEFDHLHEFPNAKYCGEVTSHSFDLRHVRYSPMSSTPNIEGEIISGVNNTVLKLDMDIKSSYEFVRNTYYRTLLPIGGIVMLIALMVLWGTEFQWQGILLSSSFVVVAFAAVGLHRAALTSTKKKEINDFVEMINGRIVERANIQGASEEQLQKKAS